MDQPTCSMPSCDKPVLCRDLCTTCYHRGRREGTLPKLDRPKPPPRIPKPRQPNPNLSEIDVDQMTVTCELHGPGSRLRVRNRPGYKATLSCRLCDRGTGPRSRNMMTPEERRRARIWQKYGLTEEGYMLMAASQQGRCLICRDDSSELVIDHCHATGEVRGLLCHRCNVALGWMNDSPTNLVRAARYLKRFAA